MDPLTHTLVGAALARTRLGRASAFAGLALIGGANLPDVDVLSFVAGADASLGFRRGWTHGPPALVVLPVLWTALLLLLDRRLRRRADDRPDAPRARPGMLLGLSFLACLTHPLLDWLNTYGIRLLMPFDDRWFYGDAMFIVDPWMWLLLGGAVFLGRPGRRIGWAWATLGASTTVVVLLATEMVPIGARIAWLAGLVLIGVLDRRVPPCRRAAPVATAALVLASVYVLALTTATTVGARWVRTELARQGVSGVGRLMVGPVPANPFRWNVVAETPTSYRHGDLRWLPERGLDLEPQLIPRPAPSSPIVAAALAAPGIRGSVSWMRFPYVEIDEDRDGYTVYVLDARYVRRRTRGFGAAVVRLDRRLEPMP